MGMTGNYVLLPEETIQQIAEKKLDFFDIAPPTEDNMSLDIDKSWQAIHFLLCGGLDDGEPCGPVALVTGQIAGDADLDAGDPGSLPRLDDDPVSAVRPGFAFDAGREIAFGGEDVADFLAGPAQQRHPPAFVECAIGAAVEEIQMPDEQGSQLIGCHQRHAAFRRARTDRRKGDQHAKQAKDKDMKRHGADSSRHPPCTGLQRR